LTNKILYRIKRWIILQWDWSPKKPIVLLFAFIFLFSSFFWLSLGVAVNPAFQSFFNPQSPTKEKTLLTQHFDIPDPMPSMQKHDVAVDCKVVGTNFAVGEPIGIYLTISFDYGASHTYNIVSVEGEPVNGMDYWLNAISQNSTTQSYIRMSNSTENDFYQNWNGANTAVFLASGMLAVKINLIIEPTSFTQDYVDWKNWDSYYSAVVQFPDLQIESGQNLKQQQNNDATFSLTYIVLFFASVDIAVVLYDHSEDKDKEKQAEYRKRKGEKKRRYPP
jgi:hypothetical protein